MKKIFGILFLVYGIICLPDLITFNPAQFLGRLIVLTLISFLPAYLLLRKGRGKNSDGINK